MKTNRWRGFAAASVLVVGVLAVWGTASPGQPQARRRGPSPAWEYKFVEAKSYLADYEKVFDDMGKQGWEYCEVRQIMKVDDPEGQKFIHDTTVIIFKRQVYPTAP